MKYLSIWCLDMLRPEYEEMFDTLDAAFFSGDELYDKEALLRVEMYIERWQRRVLELKPLIAQEDSCPMCDMGYPIIISKIIKEI